MTTKKQSGFGVTPIIAIVAVVALLGFIALTLLKAQSNKSTAANSMANNQTSPESAQPSPAPAQNNSGSPQAPALLNTVADYYAPVNISFTHDKKWSYDTSGETYGYANHPNEKSAQLRLPYQGAHDTLPSRYTIGFTSDTIPPTIEPDLTTFTQLGHVSLGTQTLYILRAYYDKNVDSKLDKIVTSGCPDKACSFQLNGTGLYFDVAVSKGVQAAAPLDDAMVPEIASILGSMRIGKQ